MFEGLTSDNSNDNEFCGQKTIYLIEFYSPFPRVRIKEMRRHVEIWPQIMPNILLQIIILLFKEFFGLSLREEKESTLYWYDC